MTENKRFIFEFFDGEKDVKRDPKVLWRSILKAINKSGRDLQALAKQASHPEVSFEAADQAESTLADIFREGLGVKPFDEGGLTEEEIGLVGQRFLAFIDAKKKSGETGQKSSQSTDSLEDFDSTKTENSASGSTKAGQKRSRRQSSKPE